MIACQNISDLLLLKNQEILDHVLVVGRYAHRALRVNCFVRMKTVIIMIGGGGLQGSAFPHAICHVIPANFSPPCHIISANHETTISWIRDWIFKSESSHINLLYITIVWVGSESHELAVF